MSYQIADEPIETSLRAYAVRPTVPLLALMVAGGWLAWPWFAFNAYAIGSPTRRREAALAAAAIAGTGILAAILVALVDHRIIDSQLVVDLGVLAIVTFKVAMGYYLSALAGRTFHVYEYYGGTTRNPRIPLALGRILRGAVIGLSTSPIWIIIVAGNELR